MFTKIKQLFADSFAFAFATLGNKLVSFLLLPILTRLLGLQLYGIWDTTNTITMLLSYICILGTDAAFAFYYFDVKSEEERKSYFSTMMFYSVGVSLVFLAFILIFSEPFALLYYKTTSYSILLILAFISTIIGIVIQHLLALARYKRRTWLFNSFSMIYWIGSTLLNILFVIRGYGVEGMFWGQVIAGGVTSLILVIIFRDEFTLRIKKSYLINLLKYGIPIVPSLLSFWVMSALSRPLIFHLYSEEDVGIYGAAVRFASFITLITSAFQLAWRPFAMSIKERDDAPQIFSIIARFLLVFGTLAILGLTFFIKPIMLVYVSKDFYTSYPIVWMLSLSTLLNTLYSIFSVGLLITKKTKVISHAFTIGTVFYLVLNLLLVPMYSYWGTAIVTLITYLFIVYFVYSRGQKYYAIPFKMGSITAYLSIYIAVMSMVTYCQVNNVESIWMYNMIALLVVIISIFSTKVFSVQTVIELRRKLPSLLSGIKKT